MRNYDVIIMGAGIAGMGAAAAFARKKKKVLLLDRLLPGEASPLAAGILDPYLELEEGSPLLGLTLEGFKTFPSLVRRLERVSGLSTGYQRTGMLYVAAASDEEELLRERYRWQSRFSLPLQWLERRELHHAHPGLSPQARVGLYYPTVGRIRAASFVKALRIYVKKRGVRLISTRLRPVIHFRSKSEDYRVRVGGRTYYSGMFVNAAGSWASANVSPAVKLPVKPARGQIYVLSSDEGPKTIIHTLTGFYLVPWKLGKYLAGSTVEFQGYRPRVSRLGRDLILGQLKNIYPRVKKMPVTESWAGLRPYSPDGLPVIGPVRANERFYAATGYFRSGILIGMHAGKLLAEAACSGEMPSVLKPFCPSRLNA